MPFVDVWVYTQFVHPNGELDEPFEEYVSHTNADPGEIIAALQVLYPTMVGSLIMPATKEKPDA